MTAVWLLIWVVQSADPISNHPWWWGTLLAAGLIDIVIGFVSVLVS